MEEKGIALPELSCRTATERPPPDFSAPGGPPELPDWRPDGFGVIPAASAVTAKLRRQPSSSRAGSSAAVRQLSSQATIPFSSMSRLMDFRESRPKFPILLNHGRDISHYESLLVVKVPETSDAVFMIHNII